MKQATDERVYINIIEAINIAVRLKFHLMFSFYSHHQQAEHRK